MGRSGGSSPYRRNRASRHYFTPTSVTFTANRYTVIHALVFVARRSMNNYSFTFLTVGSVPLLNISSGIKSGLYYLLLGGKKIELSACQIVLPMVFFARTTERKLYNIVVHNLRIAVRNGYKNVGHNFLMEFYSIPSSSRF